MTNLQRTNRRILLTKGEVHSERKDKVESLQASYSKLLTSTEQLSDLLDEPMPEMEEKKVDENEENEETEIEEVEGEAAVAGINMSCNICF